MEVIGCSATFFLHYLFHETIQNVHLKVFLSIITIILTWNEESICRKWILGGKFVLFSLTCYQNPYLRKIRTTVKKIRNDLVLLEDIIYFPGAGGQASDSGKINRHEIVGSLWEGGELWLRVPEHQFAVNDVVDVEIDWKRRYKLMKAHTAEHLLVRAITDHLKMPIKLHKIDINPASSKVILVGKVTWSDITKAVIRVNQWINEQLLIQDEIMPITDAKDILQLRARWERIEDDLIRVVRIGSVDAAACKGLHVRCTKEIEVLVVKKVNYEKKTVNQFTIIEFLVGDDAFHELLQYQFVLGEIRELFPTTPLKHLSNTLNKVLNDNKMLRTSIKEIITQSLSQGNSIILKDQTRIIIYVFSDFIPKDLSRIVLNELRRKEDAKIIMVLLAHDRQEQKWHFQFLKSKNVTFDLKNCLEKAFKDKKWKGGGKKGLFSGILLWEGDVLKIVTQSLKECIES